MALILFQRKILDIMQNTEAVVIPFMTSQLKKFIKRTQDYLEGVQELLDNCEDSGTIHLCKVVENDEESGVYKMGGKQKKEKDPDAPKQTVSAFILYSIDRRNEMKAKNSGNQCQEIDRVNRKREDEVNR